MKFVDSYTEAVVQAVARGLDGKDVLVAFPRVEMAEQAFYEALSLVEDDPKCTGCGNLRLSLEFESGGHISFKGGGADSYRGLHVHELLVYEPRLHDEEFFKAVVPHVEDKLFEEDG